MNTKFCKTLVAAALVASATASQAEMSANIAASSNYLFRGLSQTDDGAAVSGGIDYDFGNGFSAGTWISNIDFGGKESAEVDLYGGYGGEYNDVGYSVGAIYFWYPGAGGDAQGGELDYAELNVGLSYKMVSGSINYTVWGETEGGAFDDGDVYYNLSADLPVEGDFGVTVFAGYYDFDEADSYTHWGASVSKDVGELGSFSLTYEQTNGDEADDVATSDSPDFWVGWAKDF